MAKKDIVVAENLDLTAYDVVKEGVEEIVAMIQSNVGSVDLNEFSTHPARAHAGRSPASVTTVSSSAR